MKKYALFFALLLTGAMLFAQQVNTMVCIPSGTFEIGSQERTSNGDSSRLVTVDTFYMGKYPVTQKEYRDVMGTNPSGFTGGGNCCKGDNLPVENVSWYDAIEFCNKLSEKENKTPAYHISADKVVTWNREADGYRLPTDAEWEYACRAGTTTVYYTGDTITKRQANYAGRKTIDVGKFLPNAFGLYDMHGNVWEWCWNWYNFYTNTERTSHNGNDVFVLCGGSWRSHVKSLGSAIRYYATPSLKTNQFGFRVVLPHPELHF